MAGNNAPESSEPPAPVELTEDVVIDSSSSRSSLSRILSLVCPVLGSLSNIHYILIRLTSFLVLCPRERAALTFIN